MSAEQDAARQRTRLARTHLRGVLCARDEGYEEAEESCLSAIELNPKNSPAVMLLTVTYLLWDKGGEERGRTSALRNIPELAEDLFDR